MTPVFGLRKPPDPPVETAPVTAPKPAPAPPVSALEPGAAPVPGAARVAGRGISQSAAARDTIRNEVVEAVNPEIALRMNRSELVAHVERAVATIANERRFLLNAWEQRNLANDIVDDMVGLGPLERLLHDDSVTDILVNGPRQIYVETNGKLRLTDVHFRSDEHLMNVIQRIAGGMNRPIDESVPMLDARLADGSRVNAIIPPLSLRGPCLSIRKFSKSFMGLDEFVARGSASPALAQALKIAARCRLNIIIAGGTGSGKTTLLNALSYNIDPGERIITIEDAAELQLHQPHVVQLETRPANIEGRGQVTQRDLVRNALRMRPDRIILGEVRGAESFDMLQAMNTGHSGSMSTVHANSPRDALARIENLVLTANLDLPARAIRAQIASAFDMIVQIERMRDGARRITSVVEVAGTEGDTITTQPLFAYRYEGESEDGALQGRFEATGLRPGFMPRMAYYGLDRAFLEAISGEPAQA